MTICNCSLAGTQACENCSNRPVWFPWIWNGYGLWSELRGMRNLLDIQKKRIDALEKVYYSTNGG